jgi:hypothetical protein
MLGNFQRSELRIEVTASARKISDRLTLPTSMSKWMFPQQLKFEQKNRLIVGDKFSNSIGPVVVKSEVMQIQETCLRLRLSKGIDGYHEWLWGDGWVQSRLEGISLIPLNLCHTSILLRLQRSLKLEDRG